MSIFFLYSLNRGLILHIQMGSAQSQLCAYVFPELSDSDLQAIVGSFSKLLASENKETDLKFEQSLGKGRVCWSMLVRNASSSQLLLMRLFARSLVKPGLKRSSSSTSHSLMDPFSASKLSFIHELYYEKCSQFDFVLKPLFITESEDFLVLLRPFSRFNLPDKINTYSKVSILYFNFIEMV
jgi:hypothetical protein